MQNASAISALTVKCPNVVLNLLHALEITSQKRMFISVITTMIKKSLHFFIAHIARYKYCHDIRIWQKLKPVEKKEADLVHSANLLLCRHILRAVGWPRFRTQFFIINFRRRCLNFDLLILIVYNLHRRP